MAAAFLIIGIALCVAGASTIYRPLGLIVGGIFFVVIGADLARPDK